MVSKEQEVEVGGPDGRQLKSPGPEGSQSQSGWRKKDSVRYAGCGLHRIQKYGEATMGESVSAPCPEEQSSLTPHVLMALWPHWPLKNETEVTWQNYYYYARPGSSPCDSHPEQFSLALSLHATILRFF